MAQKDPCSNDEVTTVGGEGGERGEGSGKVVERLVDTNGAQQMVVDGIDGTNGSQKWVVPPSFINQRPVAWDEVIMLPQKYKVYKDFIMKNAPVLFRGGSENNVVSTHLKTTGPS